MTVKRLCILVVLTTILFVQEELLTFLPNVQLLIPWNSINFFGCSFVHLIALYNSVS